MKTLIIYAHPKTEGHPPIILEEVKSFLKDFGEDYEIIDLYKIKYDPVLHEEEHYTSGNRNISKQNKLCKFVQIGGKYYEQQRYPFKNGRVGFFNYRSSRFFS